MDRGYLSKEFFVFLLSQGFDWVTKAKRNTALYRKVIESGTRRTRFVPVTPVMLIKEVFKELLKLGTSGLVSMAIPNIYMKLPYPVTNKKGKVVTKHRFILIAAVVATRLKEDEETETKASATDIADENDSPATYRGAYLIISNRHDVPQEALATYVKRWRIKVFFRTAKQELGMESCHSPSEAHHHAHFELLFAAETLLAYAKEQANNNFRYISQQKQQNRLYFVEKIVTNYSVVPKWQLNKEETSDGEGYTHGEMVRGLFHTRCQTRIITKKGNQRIYIDFDIQVQQFARLIQLFWPDEIGMYWVPKDPNYQQLPSTT